jgi:hypothetical protein
MDGSGWPSPHDMICVRYNFIPGPISTCLLNLPTPSCWLRIAWLGSSIKLFNLKDLRDIPNLNGRFLSGLFIKSSSHQRLSANGFIIKIGVERSPRVSRIVSIPPRLSQKQHQSFADKIISIHTWQQGPNRATPRFFAWNS